RNHGRSSMPSATSHATAWIARMGSAVGLDRRGPEEFLVLRGELGRDGARAAAREEESRVGAAAENFLEGVAPGVGGGERRLDRLQQLLHQWLDLLLPSHRGEHIIAAMHAPWTPLGSTARYARGKLSLREDVWRLPDGVERVYPVLVVGPTVGVLPFVDDTHVLIIGQYRHLLREISWELPGGGALPGEDPLAAAQRELREEGGYRADHLTFLTRFWPSTAYLDEVAYCYAARGLTLDPLPADD